MKGVVIGLVVLVLFALGAWWLIGQADDNNQEAATPQTTQQQTEEGQANTEQTTPTQTEQSDASAVEIEDFAFTPANITVKAGTTVTWTNRDNVDHTVTKDDGSATGPDSGLLGQGESYSFTFNEPGTYSYHCEPHPEMTGTVTVTE